MREDREDRGVDRKRDVEKVEGEEDQEIQCEQKLHRRQCQDLRDRQLGSGPHREALLVFLPEELANVDALGIGAEHAGRGVGEAEDDD